MLVSYDDVLDRNFETKTLKKLSQIFVNADKFYKIIEKKINDLADSGIGNVNYLSIDSAIGSFAMRVFPIVKLLKNQHIISFKTLDIILVQNIFSSGEDKE